MASDSEYSLEAILWRLGPGSRSEVIVLYDFGQPHLSQGTRFPHPEEQKGWIKGIFLTVIKVYYLYSPHVTPPNTTEHGFSRPFFWKW